MFVKNVIVGGTDVIVIVAENYDGCVRNDDHEYGFCLNTSTDLLRLTNTLLDGSLQKHGRAQRGSGFGDLRRQFPR